MATTPRYVPTLTEVVKPMPSPARPGAGVSTSFVAAAGIDPPVLAQDVVDKLTPLLATHLRRSAHELLEMHLREVLPALQMALEAEVRRAVDEALSDRSGKPQGKA